MDERLSVLVVKVEEIRFYFWFRVGTSNLAISRLQYKDDSLLVVVPTFDNMWRIKVIIRDFELAPGLRVNFFKCSLIRVNVDLIFLTSTS